MHFVNLNWMDTLLWITFGFRKRFLGYLFFTPNDEWNTRTGVGQLQGKVKERTWSREVKLDWPKTTLVMWSYRTPMKSLDCTLPIASPITIYVASLQLRWLVIGDPSYGITVVHPTPNRHSSHLTWFNKFLVLPFVWVRAN